MPLNMYEGTFEIMATHGEAEKIFGQWPSSAGGAANPKLKIRIDPIDGRVTFKVEGATGDPGMDFSSIAEARYIDGISFEQQNWMDPMNDIIIGHINWSNIEKRQLFLMWSRADYPVSDPKNPCKLVFFFFQNKTRFSAGSQDMFLSASGQESGGGSGNGPNKS